MSSVLQEPVLVLDNSWRPHALTPVRNAITSVCVGRAFLLVPSTYQRLDFDEWVEASSDNTFGESVRRVCSPSLALVMPEILVLARFVGKRPRMPRLTRRNLFTRDNHMCQYCGEVFHPSKLTLDHVVPKAFGGKTVWENSVTSCRRCNNRKADKTPTQAGLRNVYPKRPTWIAHMISVSGKKSVWKPFLKQVKM